MLNWVDLTNRKMYADEVEIYDPHVTNLTTPNYHASNSIEIDMTMDDESDAPMEVDSNLRSFNDTPTGPRNTGREGRGRGGAQGAGRNKSGGEKSILSRLPPPAKTWAGPVRQQQQAAPQPSGGSLISRLSGSAGGTPSNGNGSKKGKPKPKTLLDRFS